MGSDKTVKMGEWGQDTGLKYKDGSPVHIGDYVEFDQEVWFANRPAVTRDRNAPPRFGNRFFVGYENGEVQCLGAISEIEHWTRLSAHDEVLMLPSCSVTIFDRELMTLQHLRAILPPYLGVYDVGAWRHVNRPLRLFEQLPSSARWMVVSDHTYPNFQPDTPILLDLN